jgi:hypothetical protein
MASEEWWRMTMVGERGYVGSDIVGIGGIN